MWRQKNEKTKIKTFYRRNKMKKVQTLILIFSFVVLFAASSFAQPFQGRRQRAGFQHRSPTGILRILKAQQKELNITDSQLGEIENFVSMFEEKMVLVKNEGNLLHLELSKLMKDKENHDYGKIHDALSKVSGNRNAIFIESLKLRDGIENILTPEQREAIKELRGDRHRDRRSHARRNNRGMQRGQRGHRGRRFQRTPRVKRTIK